MRWDGLGEKYGLKMILRGPGMCSDLRVVARDATALASESAICWVIFAILLRNLPQNLPQSTSRFSQTQYQRFPGRDMNPCYRRESLADNRNRLKTKGADGFQSAFQNPWETVIGPLADRRPRPQSSDTRRS